MRNFSGKAPTFVVWVISLVLFIVALLAQFGESTRPISERSVRLARQGYQQGLIPIFEVVQAQRQQAELDKANLGTLDQFLQALVRLHTAVGDYTSNSLDANSQP